MTETTDRTWELPKHPWILRMTWSELLFAHWPVDPNILAPLLPVGLTLDTHEGSAWIGVVPFLMSDVAPRCCPSIPKLSRFLELNVRTYVIYDGKPGVWFFSLDAASRVAVRAARATFNLPYMDASMSLNKSDSDLITYQSERTHRGQSPATFDASYRAIGETFHALYGTLEHWLTARYCLYSADRQGRLYRGQIDHAPWSLSLASCEERQNTMCAPLGIDLIGRPHLLFAQPIDVHAWMAVRCDY
jgi:uncharacterized protein YqjF (DUF2071 family)